MAKFDYAQFDTGNERDRQLVFHAKKHTIAEAVEIFKVEYRHLFLAGTHRVPTLDDFYVRSVRYYLNAPDFCGDRKRGLYSYCGKDARGSFPVLVCDIDSLKVTTLNAESSARFCATEKESTTLQPPQTIEGVM